jgi:deoxyribonuclease-4
MVQGKGEGRACIIAEVVCDEVGKDGVSLHGIFSGVKVLEEGKAEALANLIADGQEKETSTILTKLPHGCRYGCTRWKEKVGFTLSLFRVKQANRVALFERFNSAFDVRLHTRGWKLTFMKSRMHSPLNINSLALQKRTANRKGLSCGSPWVGFGGGNRMPIKLGPAGVPLSCKGRTIVEGMDDIISLGLETMEVQTVRMVAPQHFEQYWQAGVLANKTDFEMNIHGPYYSELLGNRVERGRSLAKIEATLQAARTVNARHITLHAGHYGEFGRGTAANEQVANVYSGIVDRIHNIWHDDEDEFPVFPWIKDGTPSKIGVETSGRQELWGSLEEVLEVVNHVEGTVPVLNIAHIHARGHGQMRTSEDYGELFDKVRESIGTKQFYCHFSGVEHRTGNAMHYTQIKKSDLNFEPLAEFIVEDGGWLDITLISDSPLLEHDAMYMLQNIEKSRHRQLERKAREDRRRALALQTGKSEEELRTKESQIAEARTTAPETSDHEETAPAAKEVQSKPEPQTKAKAKKADAKKADAKKAESSEDVFDFEEEDDDLF